MQKGTGLRVACANEREALMGFRPSHTQGRKQKFTEDIRCSMIGNSFHTGVVAVILKVGLRDEFPFLDEVTMDGLVESLGLNGQIHSEKCFVARHGLPWWKTMRYG